MFKFLKEKLGKVLGGFSKKVEEEAEKQTIIVEAEKQKTVSAQKIIDKKPEQKKEKEKAKEEKTIPVHRTQTHEKELHEEKKQIQQTKKTEHVKETTREAPQIKEQSKEQKPQIDEKHDENKGFFSKIFKKEEPKPQLETEPEEKKGFFNAVTESFTKFKLSNEKFEELFWDLEVALLENNVAVEVIDKIKIDLKEELTTGKISRKNPEEIIKDTLRKSITEILEIEKLDILKEIKNKKPYIISMIGVNGSGKTTALAKLANYLQKKGLTVVVAASDTFRAAAIQQLQEHTDKIGVKLIKHDYNSDPAAVAFDAVKHAEAKGLDVVLIDTAGRLHSNDNLMNELKKLIKVNKPDLKIFVGESITGNDCVEQAKVYNEQIGIDAIILTKADIDEKGGAPLSISYVVKKPVIFIGTGQTYEDFKPFNKEEIIENLGLA